MRTTKQVLRQSEGLPELRLLASGRFQDLRILRNGSEVGKEEVAEVKREMSPIPGAVILYLVAVLALALAIGVVGLIGYGLLRLIFASLYL